jgi:hypothetical protein
VQFISALRSSPKSARPLRSRDLPSSATLPPNAEGCQVGHDGVCDSNANLLSVGNDLCRYAPSTGLWTWIGGSTTQGAPSVYGTEGTAAPGNVPGGRDIGVSWSDGAGNFWLFGCYVPAAALNDLWKYVPPGPIVMNYAFHRIAGVRE